MKLSALLAACAAIGLLGATAALTQGPAPAPASTDAANTWATFNGDLMAQKFAQQGQITPQNAGRLKLAWQVHTGDMSDGSGAIPASDWSATPLFVNDTVYVGTPFYRIFAIAPDTGRVKWTFNPHAVLKAPTQPDMKTRGVAYWQAAQPRPGVACEKMVYVGSMMGQLYGVDADTGKPCPGFGRGGVLDVNQWNTVNPKWPLSLLQPPTVYKDTLFLGWAGKDWAAEAGPPGTVFALDARTGRLKWTFHTLPPQDASTTGTANVWASMSVDPQRGILYLPVSSPSPNFYGGARKEPLPYTTSITALDAETGKLLWSRQLVHHDVWDIDTEGAPVLVDLKVRGQVVPALVQSSKQGFFYVLNRVTGEPIFPMPERPVPQSTVPGERTSATQPEPPIPQPVIDDRWPGVSALADIVGFGQCSREARRLRYQGRFTPPALGAGALAYPSTASGVEWGGGAVDPRTGAYVVNSSRVVQVYQLLTRKDYDTATHGGQKTKDYYPQTGAPYGMHLTTFLNWAGMPCWKPPYGILSAYDLNSGRLLWREPFGAVQKWGFYMPDSWGSVTIGGPLVTSTGVVFIGGSMDSKVRAIDLKTGKVLWKGQVDAPAVAIPATYTYKGRQYVVFTAGGNSILTPRVGDQLAAFALP